MASIHPIAQRRVIKAAGLMSIFGALFFALSVFILGLVQPGYNHIIDTISVLVLGKYGWVQNINFLVLALSLIFLGIGLGLYFYKTIRNSISFGFLFLSLCLSLDILFQADPVDRIQTQLKSFHSQAGFIHFAITFIMVILIPVFFIKVIKKLNSNTSSRHLGIYTIWVISLNLVFGLLWFYCRIYGIGFEIKGIWQKGIVLNVLIWMIVLGKWLFMLK